MKTYEGMFVVDTKECKKGSESVEEKVRALIKKCGGEVKEFAKWDERKLAYEIKGTTNGTYFLTYFTGVQDTVGRLNRECELSPMVLRAMFLNIKEIPDLRAGRGKSPRDIDAEDAPAPEDGPGEAESGDSGEKGPDAGGDDDDGPPREEVSGDEEEDRDA